MNTPEILDDERLPLGIGANGKSILYAISKWGKTYILLAIIRMIYLATTGAIGSVNLLGTLMNDIYYHAFHFFKIIIAIVYLPSIYFHYQYYHHQNIALKNTNSFELNTAFRNLLLGIKWSIAALLIDFGLSIFFEFYMTYFMPG